MNFKKWPTFHFHDFGQFQNHMAADTLTCREDTTAIVKTDLKIVQLHIFYFPSIATASHI